MSIGDEAESLRPVNVPKWRRAVTSGHRSAAQYGQYPAPM